MKKAVTDSLRLERVGASARDMRRRLMEHITNKTTDRGAGPMFNDAGAHNDPKWFEAEKRELFRKLPLMVGLSRDIPRPGDKSLFDAVGPSILIVYVVAGTAQANLKYAPEGFRVVYGSNEIALQRFQRRVAELIGRGLIER